jgi:hypothetical protein
MYICDESSSFTAQGSGKYHGHLLSIGVLFFLEILGVEEPALLRKN